MSPTIVLPHRLVQEIVEVKILEMLELGPCRREELLADTDMIVHRAADIEKQQHLDGIVPFRNEPQIQQAGVTRR